MHVARERLDVLERGGREYAVAKVEDVTGPTAGTGEDIVGGSEDAIEGAEQQCWIEIALDRAVGADPLPCFVERRSPVGADHVAAGLPEQVQDRSRADAEMNRRDARAG